MASFERILLIVLRIARFAADLVLRFRKRGAPRGTDSDKNDADAEESSRPSSGKGG